jgi:ParB family transcriptional regulator, chromosome partitioning protein
MSDDRSGASPASQKTMLDIENNATTTVPVEQVIVDRDRRPINKEKVAELAESIRSIGLLSPIVVALQEGQHGKKEYHLVAGLHRLEATKLLGMASTPCIVLGRDGDLLVELAQIDENLMRNELSPAEHARHTQRRTEIMTALSHQEGTPATASKQALRRAGQTTGPDDASVRDQAKRTGESKDKIHRSKKRGGILGGLIDRVVGTSLDKGVELDALTKLPEPEREALVNRAAAGEAVSARTADHKPKTKTKRVCKVKLTRREESLEEFHAWHIKYDDLAKLARVERQIMEIEDALSEAQVSSEEGVQPLSSLPNVRDKEESGV